MKPIRPEVAQMRALVRWVNHHELSPRVLRAVSEVFVAMADDARELLDLRLMFELEQHAQDTLDLANDKAGQGCRDA